jgi:hypothetical protein
VEECSCGHLLLELLWKERDVVIYRWNYCGRKQLLSFTAEITEQESSCESFTDGITVKGRSCDHLLAELLWKERAVVIYCWNYCGKKELWSFTAGITVERSGCCHLRLELLRKKAAVVFYRWNC